MAKFDNVIHLDVVLDGVEQARAQFAELQRDIVDIHDQRLADAFFIWYAVHRPGHPIDAACIDAFVEHVDLALRHRYLTGPVAADGL